jgi:hypothetical protein
VKLLLAVQVLAVPKAGRVAATPGKVIVLPLIWKVEVKLAVPLKVSVLE